MRTALAILFIFTTSAFCQPLGEANTNALLARIASSRAGQAVQADFVEKRTLPMWKEPIIEKGTIAFEPPDRFLRKTKNLSLCDGGFLWMYYPEFHQVEKYPLDNQGPGQLFSALGQALQFQNLGENFHVTASRLPGGFRLDLIPRSGSLRRFLQSLTLELDEALMLRSSILIGKEGDRLETRYAHERILPLGSIDFTFSPPPSATVVTPLGGG